MALVKLTIFGILLALAPLSLSLPQLHSSGMPYVPSEQGLARLLMNAHLSGINPERPMKCFSDYIQKSNLISSKYSAEYKSCMDNSRNERRKVDLEVNVEKRGIILEAEGICRRLTRCNGIRNNLALLNCHAEVGSNNTQASYIISANASDFATILQESYRTISLQEEKCFGIAERVYVESTTGNYRLLQRCLYGNESPTPPMIESTTEPTTMDPSSSTALWTQSTDLSTFPTSSTSIELSTSSAIAESSSTTAVSVDLPLEISPSTPEAESSIKSA